MILETKLRMLLNDKTGTTSYKKNSVEYLIRMRLFDTYVFVCLCKFFQYARSVYGDLSPSPTYSSLSFSIVIKYFSINYFSLCQLSIWTPF